MLINKNHASSIQKFEFKPATRWVTGGENERTLDEDMVMLGNREEADNFLTMTGAMRHQSMTKEMGSNLKFFLDSPEVLGDDMKQMMEFLKTQGQGNSSCGCGGGPSACGAGCGPGCGARMPTDL